jgi:hypothetical protein
MRLATLFLSMLSLQSFCQDLTGTWTGEESGAAFVKLVVVQLNDSCVGYTYDEDPGFCKANFAGSFDAKRQKLKGKGVSFISSSADHVLCVYNLNYVKEGKEEFLEGSARIKGAGGILLSFGMPSFMALKKVSNLVDTTNFIRAQLTAMHNMLQEDVTARSISLPADSVLVPRRDGNAKAFEETTVTTDRRDKRISKTISTISTAADTVRLLIYDNGVVDDDTITVFLDNTVLISRYRITEKAREICIPLARNGSAHKVELFADNLGSIPPNTAVVVVLAGTERYEIHASFDLSTNATIILQHKE